MHLKLPQRVLWSEPDTKDPAHYRPYCWPGVFELPVAATQPGDGGEFSTVARVHIAA
jgi:hypothetical protein